MEGQRRHWPRLPEPRQESQGWGTTCWRNLVQRQEIWIKTKKDIIHHLIQGKNKNSTCPQQSTRATSSSTAAEKERQFIQSGCNPILLVTNTQKCIILEGSEVFEKWTGLRREHVWEHGYHLMSNVVHCDQVAGWRLFGNHSVQKCPFKIYWVSVAEKCHLVNISKQLVSNCTWCTPQCRWCKGNLKERKQAFLTIRLFFWIQAPGSRGEKSNLNDFFLRFNSPGASKTRALPNLQG